MENNLWKGSILIAPSLDLSLHLFTTAFIGSSMAACTLVPVKTEEEFIHELRSPDLLLIITGLDHSMLSAEKILGYVQDAPRNIPVVLLESSSPVRRIANLFKSGLADAWPPVIDQQLLLGLDVLLTRWPYDAKGVMIENDFLNVIRHSPELLSLHDIDGRYLRISQTIFKITGYKAEELNGTDLYDHIHPEDADKVVRPLHKTLLKGDNEERFSRYRFRTSDGKYRWFESVGSPLKDAEGKVSQLLLITRPVDEQVAMEERLVLHNEIQRMSLNATMSAFWVFDLDDNKLWWSDEMQELFEGDGSESMPHSEALFNQRIFPEDASKLQEIWSQLLEAPFDYLDAQPEKMVSSELRFIKKNGDIQWIRSFTKLFRKADARLMGRIVGIHLDVTHTKDLSQALRISNLQHEALINTATSGIYTDDAYGFRTYANEELARICGLTPNSCKAFGWKTNIHPEDLEKVNADRLAFATSPNTELSSEYRFLHADGTVIHILEKGMKVIDDNNVLVGYSGTLTDVTKLKQSEQELAERKLLLEEIINHENAYIFCKDKEGKIQIANQKLDKLLGGNVIDKVDYELLEPDSYTVKIRENDLEVLQSGQAKVFEEAAFFNGKLTHFLSSKSPLRNTKGEIVGLSCVAIDITDTVEADREISRLNDVLLRQYNQLRRYAHLNSNDLRSPLTNILSIVNLLKGDPTSFNRDLLESLVLASERLDAVVRELNELVQNADFEELGGDELDKVKIKSICLVDDDHIQHLINKRIIKDIDSTIEILDYVEPELALRDLVNGKIRPDLLLLDINMPVINGWDFLERMKSHGLKVDVQMLTSSIDPSDQQKSKSMDLVKGFLSKPLRKEVLKTILI